MAWYHEIGSSLAALFRRRQQDTEMDEEIRFHLEMETERNVHSGLAERDAQRRARRDFGGVERHKEDVRDARGANWFFDAWSDVRFALRSLRQRPGLTAAATVTPRPVSRSLMARPIPRPTRSIASRATSRRWPTPSVPPASDCSGTRWAAWWRVGSRSATASASTRS